MTTFYSSASTLLPGIERDDPMGYRDTQHIHRDFQRLLPIRDRTELPHPIRSWQSTFFITCGCSILIGIIVSGVFLSAHVSLEAVSRSFLAASACLTLGITLDYRRGLLSLTTSLFFLLFVAIPGLVQVESNRFPFDSVYSSPEVVQGYLILALGQLCLTIGFQFPAARRVRQDSERHAPRQRFSVYTAAAWSSITAFLLFLLAGPSIFFIIRNDAGDYFAEDSGGRQQLMYVGRSFALLALAFALYGCRRVQRTPRTDFKVWILLALSASLAVLLNYPPALSRFQLLALLLTPAALVLPGFSSRLKLASVFGAAFFLLFLFPGLKELGTGSAPSVAAWSRERILTYLTRVDFDVLKQTIDSVSYVDSQGIIWGSNFLGVLLFWIPRSLWPGKPMGTGSIIAQHHGYSYTNVSSPLPAEAYVGFGVVGLILVMLGIGICVSSLEYRVRLRPCPYSSILYSLSVAFAIIIMRGSLNSVVPMFGFAFLGLALWTAPKDTSTLMRRRP